MPGVNDIEKKDIECKSCGFIVFNADPEIALREICFYCGKIIGDEPVIELKKCESCGQEISKKAKECPKCGWKSLAICQVCHKEIPYDSMLCPECGDPHPIFVQPDQPASSSKKEENKNTQQLLGIIGSIVLFVGVFSPIVSVPIMGNMNYFQNGKGDGVIVLILATISLILVLAKKHKGLWFTGLGSLGVMLFTFVHFQSKMSQVKANMESQLAGNPFRGLADMTMQSIQLQWGWALLIVGAALVLSSAAMKDEAQ